MLAARPGVGKTSMALKMVSNIAGDVIADQGVLFFSLEVDRVDLMKKLLASESKVDFKNLDTGMVKPEEYAAVEEAAKRCKNWHLHLMDVSDLTVHGLRSVVKRHMLESQGKLRLVVLDYLQLLGSAKPDSNEYEKVSEISRVLKLIAMDMKIPVLALSQMSRESEKGASSAPREPRLSDLRGSGSIEQDADAVIFMHRADSGEGSKEDEVQAYQADRGQEPIRAHRRLGHELQSVEDAVLATPSRYPRKNMTMRAWLKSACTRRTNAIVPRPSRTQTRIISRRIRILTIPPVARPPRRCSTPMIPIHNSRQWQSLCASKDVPGHARAGDGHAPDVLPAIPCRPPGAFVP